MAEFFGISIGEEKTSNGLRVRIREDGEAVWMHGKWLELGSDHGVIWVDGGQSPDFIRADGRVLKMGSFPGWVVRGKGKHPAIAMMFSISQFIGGYIKNGSVKYTVELAGYNETA
jgi:hypothetical protein